MPMKTKKETKAAVKAAKEAQPIRAHARKVVRAVRGVEAAQGRVSEALTEYVKACYSAGTSERVAAATLKDALESASLLAGSVRSYPTQAKAVLAALRRVASEGDDADTAFAKLTRETGTAATVTACYRHLNARGEPRKKRENAGASGKARMLESSNGEGGADASPLELSSDERAIVDALAAHNLLAAIHNAVRAALRAGIPPERIAREVQKAINNNN